MKEKIMREKNERMAVKKQWKIKNNGKSKKVFKQMEKNFFEIKMVKNRVKQNDKRKWTILRKRAKKMSKIVKNGHNKMTKNLFKKILLTADYWY